jgi:hypothetical protein
LARRTATKGPPPWRSPAAHVDGPLVAVRKEPRLKGGGL